MNIVSRNIIGGEIGRRRQLELESMEIENQFQEWADFDNLGETLFLKNLSDSRANGSFQLVPFIFLVYIPGIHVLAGHNAVDANVPHHRRAVPTDSNL